MKPLSEYTRSALELSEKTTEKLRRSTHAALAKTEKIRRPSTGIDKKGTAAGGLVSIGLLLGGGVWLFWGKTLWALGTIAVGVISFLSNRSHHKRIK